MFYLISQFGWYLLVALLLGAFVGWFTFNREARQWGWLPFGLVAAIIALAVTVFRLINGVPALWIETGLLLFSFYLAGCCIGAVVRQFFQVEEPLPVMDKPVTPPVAVAVAVAGPAMMAKVEDEDLIAGSRPPGLVAPRGGTADDLKMVRGIGKQNEGRLHGLGIWHFDQIAAWTTDHAVWVGSYLAFPGRIERERWIDQARDLAAGKETEFAARVKRGEVATSQDDGSMGQSNVEQISATPDKANGGKS